MDTKRFLYVSNADVKRLLTPADAVTIARDVLAEHARGAIDWAKPRQTDLTVTGAPTWYKVKGCVLRDAGVAGFRVTGLNRTEEGYAVAAHRPTKNVLLSDPATGEFFAMVDERWGYGLRTGACGAVAVEALRNADARDCAILGTGHMAYGAALTVNEVLPLERLTVYSRNRERREAFARRLNDELGVAVTAAEDVESTVREASAVISATEATSPIVRYSWLAPGVVVYALGRFQEFDRECYERMRMIVDDREQVTVCKEIRAWIDEGSFDPGMIEADLGEVLAGTAGTRDSPSDQFFVRSQGLVTQDVAQAYWVYQQALKNGLGVDLEPALTERPGDPLY